MSVEIRDVKWPFGEASKVALTATGAQAITVVNHSTIIDGVAVPATGNRTINLTVDPLLAPGALLLVKSKTNGTETTIFGTKITGVTLVGEAGKTLTALFMYDGANFLQAGAFVKID